MMWSLISSLWLCENPLRNIRRNSRELTFTIGGFDTIGWISEWCQDPGCEQRYDMTLLKFKITNSEPPPYLHNLSVRWLGIWMRKYVYNEMVSKLREAICPNWGVFRYTAFAISHTHNSSGSAQQSKVAQNGWTLLPCGIFYAPRSFSSIRAGWQRRGQYCVAVRSCFRSGLFVPENLSGSSWGGHK